MIAIKKLDLNNLFNAGLEKPRKIAECKRVFLPVYENPEPEAAHISDFDLSTSHGHEDGPPHGKRKEDGILSIMQP
jgi:hypothetical protein